MVTMPTPMRHTPSRASNPIGKRVPVTGSARPCPNVAPRTEGLGVELGGGGVGVATGAVTGSRPTLVAVVEVLFARLGSASLAFTLAVLLSVPGRSPAVTATVAVTEAPEGSEPRLQATTPPDWLQLPCPELAVRGAVGAARSVRVRRCARGRSGARPRGGGGGRRGGGGRGPGRVEVCGAVGLAAPVVAAALTARDPRSRCCRGLASAPLA